jgi:hypothetical protein
MAKYERSIIIKATVFLMGIVTFFLLVMHQASQFFS